MNEVVPWSDRAAGRFRDGTMVTRDGAIAAWDWFTDLGPGAWLLVGGVLAVVSLVLSVVLGRSTPSVCDTTVNDVHDIRVYDGAQHLTGADALHQDARALSKAAERANGSQRAALLLLSNAAGRARDGQPFDASAALAGYHDACS